MMATHPTDDQLPQPLTKQHVAQETMENHRQSEERVPNDLFSLQVESGSSEMQPSKEPPIEASQQRGFLCKQNSHTQLRKEDRTKLSQGSMSIPRARHPLLALMCVSLIARAYTDECQPPCICPDLNTLLDATSCNGLFPRDDRLYCVILPTCTMAGDFEVHPQCAEKIGELTLGPSSVVFPGYLTNFESLAFLSLAGSSVQSLQNALSSLPDLSVLECYSCDIQQVPHDLLNGVPNIKEMHLPKSAITEIPFFNLSKFRDFTRLDLQGNLLENIDLCGYSGLPNVADVTVTDQTITITFKDGRLRFEVLISSGTNKFSCDPNTVMVHESVTSTVALSCQSQNGPRSELKHPAFCPSNSPEIDTSGIGGNVAASRPTASIFLINIAVTLPLVFEWM